MFEPREDPTPSRRAAELLADRLHEPWSVERLARTLGISCRTLHRALRRELGLSPMRLLRRVRLAQARAQLEAPEWDTSVTSVAYDCGFAHLGRFAQEYAQAYGETPSRTLRRARCRPASFGSVSRAAGSAA